MTSYLNEAITSAVEKFSEPLLTSEILVPELRSPKFTKDDIRTSLRASTLDGIFATVFSTITGGVLMSNFLVELDASPLQIGLLASMPMMANLLQPVGAYWADQTTSRRRYSRWVYGISRLLWLPLAIAILVYSTHPVHPQWMIMTTVGIMLVTHVLDAIGSASWLSWMATLVPRQLRGRYFGFRNSTFSLTSLITLPLLGITVSRWSGGSIQGFGVMMIVAVVAGLISLAYQSRMADVNPQTHWTVTCQIPPIEVPAANTKNSTENSIKAIAGETTFNHSAPTPSANRCEPIAETAHHSILHNAQFRLFLLYFGLWAFGLNLSNPFFNLYLLDNLALDVSWVTVYNGLGAGANLVMLLVWGKLADRIGSRPILLLDGLMVSLIPLLWLGTGDNSLSLWLWFPLLHLLGGGIGAAIDLCINNLQLAIAPMQHHTKYFAVTAATGGLAGAAGALVGGWMAQWVETGGIMGVFALSSVLRLVALLPLVWLQEPQGRSLKQILQAFTQPALSLWSRAD